MQGKELYVIFRWTKKKLLKEIKFARWEAEKCLIYLKPIDAIWWLMILIYNVTGSVGKLDVSILEKFKSAKKTNDKFEKKN